MSEIDLDDDMPLGADEVVLPETKVEEVKVEEVTEEKLPEKPKPDPNVVPTGFVVRDKQEEVLLLRQKVSEISTLIRMHELPDTMVSSLKEAIDSAYEDDFDINFDVREELKTQLKLLRSIRQHITNQDTGMIKESVTVSEMKSVIDAGMKLSDMLNKSNKDLINMERMQAIEAAFLETVEHLEEKDRIEFVNLLEKRLKAQEQLRKGL